MLDYKKIVAYLVKYRKDQNISQTELAKRLGYTPQNVSALEKMNILTTIEVLNNWCEALGILTLEVIVKTHLDEQAQTPDSFEKRKAINELKFLAEELKKNIDKLV